MVIVEPGMAWPVGVVPTTTPLAAQLGIGVGWSATWNPAAVIRLFAASRFRP
jgi:hypothetical protein